MHAFTTVRARKILMLDLYSARPELLMNKPRDKPKALAVCVINAKTLPKVPHFVKSCHKLAIDHGS